MYCIIHFIFAGCSPTHNVNMNTVKVSLTNTEERTYKEGGFESLLRRFNRSVQDYGVLGELRKREFYESPSTVRHRKAYESRVKYLQKERERRQEKRDDV